MTTFIHVKPTFNFYTPWKRQKTSGFLTLSRDIKLEHQRDDLFQKQTSTLKTLAADILSKTSNEWKKLSVWNFKVD